MLFIAAISLWSFLLLVKTRLVVPGSFGGKPFCATVLLLRKLILVFRYRRRIVRTSDAGCHSDFDRIVANRLRCRCDLTGCHLRNPFLMCHFRTAYTIFVAENLQAFVLAVTNCKTFIATKWLIAAQLIIVLPLSMIRNLAALSSTALIADAFILVGCKYTS